MLSKADLIFFNVGSFVTSNTVQDRPQKIGWPMKLGPMRDREREEKKRGEERPR